MKVLKLFIWIYPETNATLNPFSKMQNIIHLNSRVHECPKKTKFTQYLLLNIRRRVILLKLYKHLKVVLFVYKDQHSKPQHVS